MFVVALFLCLIAIGLLSWSWLRRLHARRRGEVADVSSGVQASSTLMSLLSASVLFWHTTSTQRFGWAVISVLAAVGALASTRRRVKRL